MLYAIIWMCQNQRGKRNATPEQLDYLMGKEYEARKVVEARNQHTKKAGAQNEPQQRTADVIAKEHGVGHMTVKRNYNFAKSVEAIAQTSTEAKHKLKKIIPYFDDSCYNTIIRYGGCAWRMKS